MGEILSKELEMFIIRTFVFTIRTRRKVRLLYNIIYKAISFCVRIMFVTRAAAKKNRHYARNEYEKENIIILCHKC